MNSGDYKMTYLLRTLEINKFNLKNRLIFPPMATYKANNDGRVSRELLDYYNEKSRGGYVSLIIIEHSFVSQQGKAGRNQLSAADDNVVDGLKKLAYVIHKNGCRTIMQINHAGSATTRDITGNIPMAPSVVQNPCKGDMPAKVTISEIQNIIEEFKMAAIRVKNAGFDGVEIHSAHGYLLNQFFSPVTNKRTDEYGGDLLGRIRIHIEIIRAIRKAVGNDFAIFLRLGACDYKEGGITIEDSKIAVREFENAGVDVLDISGGFCRYTIPGVDEPGYFAPLSKAVKNVVSIPVILTGGITKVKQAEKLLQEGSADLIGVGRAIYKDSNWSRRAIENIK